jgi:hypothetical protein
MADVTRGFTFEFKADTTNYAKGLEVINSNLTLAEQEASKVTTKFDMLGNAIVSVTSKSKKELEQLLQVFSAINSAAAAQGEPLSSMP